MYQQKRKDVQQIKNTNIMKKFYTDNQKLMEILADNGISMICNQDMDIEISDEDAARIPAIVERDAPAAFADYTIE